MTKDGAAEGISDYTGVHEPVMVRDTLHVDLKGVDKRSFISLTVIFNFTVAVLRKISHPDIPAFVVAHQ